MARKRIWLGLEEKLPALLRRKDVLSGYASFSRQRAEEPVAHCFIADIRHLFKGDVPCTGYHQEAGLGQSALQLAA